MKFRWVFVCGVIALMLVFMAVGASLLVRAASPERLASELSARLEMDVEINGEVAFALFKMPRVTLTRLKIRKPGAHASQKFLSLESVAISLRWWDLWSAVVDSRPHLLDVMIAHGEIELTEEDFSGDDAAWPSHDDPFSAFFDWVHSLDAEKIALRFKPKGRPWRSLDVQRLNAVFATGEGNALRIDLSPLDAVLGGVPLNAKLHLEAPFADANENLPATISGSVSVRSLNLDPLLVDMEWEADGTQRPLEIPTDLCRAWSGELDLEVVDFTFVGRPVQRVQLEASSTGGAIDVRLVDVEFPGGHSEGRLSLRCGSLPGALSLEIHLGSDGLPQARQEEGKKALAFNRMEASLKLAGEGRNWRELAQSLAGRFSLFLGPFETDELLVGLYGKTLFHALTVSWQEPETSVIECAVLDMAVNQGVAESQQILIGTPTLVIDGHGRVDLLQDEIEFLLVPHSKKFGFGRLEEPISIKGPIESPKVQMDWRGFGLTFGIGTALGVLNPILRALPFTDLAATEKDACQSSMREAENGNAVREKPTPAETPKYRGKKGAR